MSSVSEFVHVAGACEPPRQEAVRLVSPAPLPPASNISYGAVSQAARASRSQQLEAENRRLREMVGDLMLEAEILRAALRRSAPDLAAPSIPSLAAVRDAGFGA